LSAKKGCFVYEMLCCAGGALLSWLELLEGPPLPLLSAVRWFVPPTSIDEKKLLMNKASPLLVEVSGYNNTSNSILGHLSANARRTILFFPVSEQIVVAYFLGRHSELER
jgi:hypothetical protein